MSDGIVVDLFAGGGGASLGLERALGRCIDLGVNHDADAIRNHALNHPRTQHLTDDIRQVVPLVATGGRPVDVLWASPDCKHFSRCKGGKPLDESVRTLPWQVIRWARETRPTLICIENVPEMRTWGPLDDEGYPIPEMANTTWEEWLQSFRDLGYRVAWWILHAHDYGAPTSRKRLFVVARRDGLEPVCPEPTHGPGRAHPHRTAAECIDWNDLGQSIFDENGDPRHAPATCRRIAKGVVRFVLEAKEPFIVTCNHGKEGFRGQALTEPFRTITASHDAHGLVVPSLVHIGNGERSGQAPRVYDLQRPLGTVVAGGPKHALVSAFMAKHYGGVTGHELGRTLGTITAKDHHSLVAANLIRTDMQSDGRLRGLTSLDKPLKTVTTGNGHALVAAFMQTYYGQSVGRALDEPMATQTTKDRHSLVTVTIDRVTYVIEDILLRMLQPHELQLAQGFPASYRLDGSKKLKVRLIGNSVPPQLAEAVVRANTAGTRLARGAA